MVVMLAVVGLAVGLAMTEITRLRRERDFWWRNYLHIAHWLTEAQSIREAERMTADE